MTEQEDLPENQLFGHNGNSHTRAHLHLDLQGATSTNLLPSLRFCNFPRTISPRQSPGASPGAGTASTSSRVAQHQPTDSSSSRCFHSHKVIAMVGDSFPYSTVQMGGSHSKGLSCQCFFMLSTQKDWEAFLKVYLPQRALLKHPFTSQSCTFKGSSECRFTTSYRLTVKSRGRRGESELGGIAPALAASSRQW